MVSCARNANSQFAHRRGISPEEFVNILVNSLKTKNHSQVKNSNKPKLLSFQQWQVSVGQQIKDLDNMADNGQLNWEYRSGGMNAPSGQRWYNFEISSYIECGLAGAFGGDYDGDRRTISEITWKRFSDFIWCGQNYE